MAATNEAVMAKEERHSTRNDRRTYENKKKKRDDAVGRMQLIERRQAEEATQGGSVALTYFTCLRL